MAKQGYVVSRCGWFSDRSICYLASGRPVIAQNTGFSHFLPTGAGVFSFDDINGVIEAVNHIDTDYEYHSQSARLIAEKYFDSDVVLTRFLKNVGFE